MDFEDYITQNLDAIHAIESANFARLRSAVVNVFLNDGTIWTAGNGGSYSTATHLVCDLNKGVSDANNIHLRAFCLMDNFSTITAWSNDYDYESAISRSLQINGRERDMLLLISGSGNSPNIIKAAQTARSMNIAVASLTGFDGGEVKKLSDINLNIQSSNMQVIENLHLMVCHALFSTWS